MLSSSTGGERLNMIVNDEMRVEWNSECPGYYTTVYYMDPLYF